MPVVRRETTSERRTQMSALRAQRQRPEAGPSLPCYRIGITYEAEAENVTSEDLINTIVNEIEVP